MEINIDKFCFDNFEEFSTWKAGEEEKCKSHYVQHSSSRIYGATKYRYLYCNRSGKVRVRGKGERQLKSQGSSKVGLSCIAYMKVMEDTIQGAITVEYCSHHNSHSIKLSHLPIPPDIKHHIAAKLHDGVSIERILDDVRETMTNGEIGREQLLSRQDILNIQRRLNLESVRKDTNDLLSTCAWVEEMAGMSYNPVLLFKPQGIEQSETMNDLAKDDFILALQTEFQRDAMMQYGSKVILMDATHGTTQYDFQLISILVIDDFGEGLPVAWAISNREDVTLLVQFLKAVHTRVGNIETAYFMSDCAEQYYNAWSGVFGTHNTKRLLCIWHVDRAWRTALNQHIPNRQERIEVYHQL